MAQLPDSGERRSFSTGSVRDKADGKGSFHLMSPFALEAYARRMEDGMSKYGERNWEKGQPVMTYLDSAERHINDFKRDCILGNEPAEDHLGAALWNVGAAIHTLRMIEEGLLPEELDDRPFPHRVLGKEKPTTDAVEILRRKFGKPGLPECPIEDTHCCYRLADGCCDHPSEDVCEPEQPDMPKSPSEDESDYSQDLRVNEVAQDCPECEFYGRSPEKEPCRSALETDHHLEPCSGFKPRSEALDMPPTAEERREQEIERLVSKLEREWEGWPPVRDRYCYNCGRPDKGEKDEKGNYSSCPYHKICARDLCRPCWRPFYAHD